MFVLLSNICCIIAFMVQALIITLNYLHPNQTTTDTFRHDLVEMDFPVIFKICVVPGFNDSEVKRHGYAGTNDYFYGISNSIIGWGGHFDGVKERKSSDGNTISLFSNRNNTSLIFRSIRRNQDG